MINSGLLNSMSLSNPFPRMYPPSSLKPLKPGSEKAWGTHLPCISLLKSCTPMLLFTVVSVIRMYYKCLFLTSTGFPVGSHKHGIWQVERKPEPCIKLPTTHLSLKEFILIPVSLISSQNLKSAFIELSTEVRRHSCYLEWYRSSSTWSSYSLGTLSHSFSLLISFLICKSQEIEMDHPFLR